jgi:hypothetical protein
VQSLIREEALRTLGHVSIDCIVSTAPFLKTKHACPGEDTPWTPSWKGWRRIGSPQSSHPLPDGFRTSLRDVLIAFIWTLQHAASVSKSPLRVPLVGAWNGLHPQAVTHFNALEQTYVEWPSGVTNHYNI